MLTAHGVERLGACSNGVREVAQLAELCENDLSIRRIVLRYKDARTRNGPGGSGRRRNGRDLVVRGQVGNHAQGGREPKRRPRPFPASTSTEPPIIAASCLQMASPRPVPPYFRVVEASACTKGRTES